MMIYKLGLVGLGLSLVLFTGCGSSDSNPINDKNFVVIASGVPAGICENELYINTIIELGIVNPITEETGMNTTCETYGKTNDGFSCIVEPVGLGDKNCVVGFDTFVDTGSLEFAKKTSADDLAESTEIIINSL